ncbi:MAG: hypothetical protein HY758_02430 [Nitrospirae bacterium]|nr:hypothetical protein [Nitrospirota bacterium]
MTTKVVRLLNDILQQGRFKKNALLLSTQSGFPIATDLVDFLTIKCGLDNRSAHSIIGLVARRLINKKYAEITSAMLYEAGRELGIKLKKFNENDFSKLLDIKNLIELRSSRGGAGTKAVNNMILDCRKKINHLRSFFGSINDAAFKKTFYLKIEKLIKRYQ